MINTYSYSNNVLGMKLFVKYAYDDRQNVELNYELPDFAHLRPHGYICRKGEAKTEYYQKFMLKPNSYIFSLWIMLDEDDDLNDSDVKVLIKVGSVSECTMEEL